MLMVEGRPKLRTIRTSPRTWPMGCRSRSSPNAGIYKKHKAAPGNLCRILILHHGEQVQFRLDLSLELVAVEARRTQKQKQALDAPRDVLLDTKLALLLSFCR